MFSTISVSCPTHFNEYPIYIGADLFAHPEILLNYIAGQQVLIVTDTQVAPLYLEKVCQLFTAFTVDHLILPAGEKTKTLTHWSQILDTLIEKEHTRSTSIIALGGGVIGDLAGFAGACYHRGVNVIQIPTTLLAQVDASVGGKTAINHTLGKNLIGAFHQPSLVLIDTQFLLSLPPREYYSGLAEVIKTALILDAHFLSWLEAHVAEIKHRDPDALQYLIAKSCQLKANIVKLDELDKSSRAILNFGHTVGHALENALDYGHWRHGEAVALGMLVAMRLSQTCGFITPDDILRVQYLLEKFQLPTRIPPGVNSEKLMASLTRDKKSQSGKTRFVLLHDIGKAVVGMEIAYEDVRCVLHEHGLE